MKNQSEIDRLSTIVGNERAIRDELDLLDTEITSLQDNVLPLQGKQRTLLGRLAEIEQAKTELATLKSPEPAAAE